MSYPQLLHDSDPKKDYVTFSVPNHRVARKIMNDAEYEENLRIQVSGKALSVKVEELAALFSKYNVEASPIEGHNELRVKLSVPAPPAHRLPERRYVVHTPKRDRIASGPLKTAPLWGQETEEGSCTQDIIVLYNHDRPLNLSPPRPRLSTIPEESDTADSLDHLSPRRSLLPIVEVWDGA
ncbi:hypothetical protein K469DRAFT_706220 [Zopfia rhizophila CBS 207.26]|uniref:Uncharacterized protein n=1 Tax=Zopfia rhizophila CBS 207.26 TaxID=1314779 RepID=A0A6A6EXT1_9PEZI|nr:hypothetical protein K469DRAFT_706220 [Zopfia rhizophila CBS 207.26]